MKVIDAHQHFWQYDPIKDAWITSDMQVLRKNYLPDELWPELQANGVEGCIAVQADQSEAETLFLLELAREHYFIKGVVGWVDLQSESIEEHLARFSGYQKLCGFRHILQGESNRALMLTPAFKRGIAALARYNYTYDLLILPDQLAYTNRLVAKFPDQKFVIDHIAKPPIKAGDIQAWRKDMKQLASYPNVWCKVSGLVTEADWQHWSHDTFKPYLDVVFEAFGSDRLMFGSDWPVCLLGGSYREVKGILDKYLASFSSDEQEKVWRVNAIRFYNLSER
jgi:L-fuconolactonase